MLLKKPDDVKGSEITPESTYLNRRMFIRGGVLAASVIATGGFYRALTSKGTRQVPAPPPPTSTFPRTAEVPGEALTSYQSITNYNNYYEFATDKEGVAYYAEGFVTRPWTLEVGGLVAKPRTFDLDELARLFPLEERVYRFRCVEAWSMVIPWLGFPLAKLLSLVEPQSTASYVAFQTLYDPKRMRNQRTSVLDWPYVEGLRLDEAMHPLTLIATGLYGRDIPPQNGAPLRLVVPWKYGFKSIKSIVKITLVDRVPPTTWNIANPSEYGFYSNVNPGVPHPRWSQATERRIGETGRRATLLFNGYADQVGELYSGLDLERNF
jgi:sulfoxide reductase catalytic subunit YedY